MYKKFIEHMIISAIENEFGFLAAVKANNIETYKKYSSDHEIYFSFETIFENCKVYGYLLPNGNADWLKNDEYHVTKEYYK